MTAIGVSPIERSLTRDELILDLTACSLQVGEFHATFESPAADDILEVYLGLVRDMRGSDAALARGLRTDDLEVLGAVLMAEPEALRLRLEHRIGERRSLRVRLAPAAAAATALASVLGVGAVILFAAGRVDPVPATSTATESAAAFEIGSAPVLAPPGLSVPSLILPELSDAAIAPLGVGVDELVPARTLEVPGGGDQTSRATEIEARIDFDFRRALPSWTIVHAGSDPTWRGLTNSIERTVTLFDRPETPVEEAAAILAHELGHAVDLDHLSDEDRNAWRSLRGITGPWWADDGLADFAVGAGDFAEAVAAVLVGSPSRSDYGQFDDAQLRFVADLLDELG